MTGPPVFINCPMSLQWRKYLLYDKIEERMEGKMWK